MQVMIVGGTGLLGRATALELMRQNVDVTLLSRSYPKDPWAQRIWKKLDIEDFQSVKEALMSRPDVVLNFAACLQHACDKQPKAAVGININGLTNILEGSLSAGVKRVIFASSIAVYGERRDLMTEVDCIPADNSLYGASKYFGELLGLQYKKTYGLDFVALRYSGIFGFDPAERSERSAGMALVRQQILECVTGKDVVFNNISGSERVHLTHVEDAARATVAAILLGAHQHGVYNVGGPSENYLSLRDFYHLLSALSPRCGNVTWAANGARSAGPLCIKRMTFDLGYVPTVSVSNGLKKDVQLILRKDFQ